MNVVFSWLKKLDMILTWLVCLKVYVKYHKVIFILIFICEMLYLQITHPLF